MMMACVFFYGTCCSSTFSFALICVRAWARSSHVTHLRFFWGGMNHRYLEMNQNDYKWQSKHCHYREILGFTLGYEFARISRLLIHSFVVNYG